MSNLKPNFLVIGAPKCATTALSMHLRRHPEIFVSHPKETFFFCYDEVYSKGWDWYLSLFKDVDSERAIGEATTLYSSIRAFPQALPRIVKHFPDAKIIYMVRHPMQRIQSNYVEFLSQGLTQLNFKEAVHEIPHFIDASCYHRQLEAYRKHYPKERINVIFYRDYKKNPEKVLQECFEFLDVDPTFVVDNPSEKIYQSKGKRRDLPITNLIRRKMPGFLTIRNVMPNWTRTIVQKALKREIKAKPNWDRETREWVISQIQSDIESFLHTQGKPVGYWDLNQ